MKRESGAFVNKAPACTKKALKQMIVYLYSTAVTASDYQDAALFPATTLIDLLGHPENVNQLQATPSASHDDRSADAIPGIHAYVNRVLDRVAKRSGVAERLTSRSFRRGSANGTGMCVQWIFDRGAWNMTATNKAFATQTKIRSVAFALFISSSGLETPQYNVNERVLDTLMAYLLKHYPQLKKLAADGPAIQRIEACTRDKGFSEKDLLSWSSYLAGDTSTNAIQGSASPQSTPNDYTQHPMYLHQASLIEQLIQVNQKLDMRLSVMEAKFYNKQQDTTTANNVCQDTITSHPPNKRRTSKMFGSLAFLKLFLPDGFILNEKSPRYRDDVLMIEVATEVGLLAFLRGLDITARGAQNVLKAMRKLHKSGRLNDRITRYKHLQAAGRIADAATAHTTNILGLL
ncbi:hypothetical protein AM587_10003221 [Phytophthora nicotianae]|uniref:Uncharacterized protein n=1 Tax=Phytophthora nicotianae TaxID=4792 RepID=A0A0W8DYN5_PHYNI|nr:hypothetical protein AM587_10003221 [Phytophthora nicotianae]